MKNILAAAQRQVLEELAWSDALLAFDYDGTLAPIVAEPARARLRRSTRHLLSAAAGLYPLVVISGRSRDDTVERLAGVEVDGVVGNHGGEPVHGLRRGAGLVRNWQAVLRRELAALQGVVVEDKTFSVAVHYRRSRAKKRARSLILSAAAELSGARVIGGKQVVNLVPQGAPHKGMALERERARLLCDTALYVGDDETDEDAFALDQPGRLITVRVGAKRSSAASYFVPNQAAVDELLRSLVMLRQRSARRREAAR